MKYLIFWPYLVGVVLMVSLFASTFTVKLEATTVRGASVEIPPSTIDTLKGDLVARLAQCEGAGHKEDDAIITYDNNRAGTLTGKTVFSLGNLQWKVSTVQHYAKLRDGSVLTQKEAVLLALDLKQASDLASYVIFETPNGINNWQNCANRLGLQGEVAIIKKLDK